MTIVGLVTAICLLSHLLGSTVVYPYNDPLTYEPVEQGASIFVQANKNLWRATDEFGLERSNFEDGDDTMGVWDGEKFVMVVCFPVPSVILFIH